MSYETVRNRIIKVVDKALGQSKVYVPIPPLAAMVADILLADLELRIEDVAPTNRPRYFRQGEYIYDGSAPVITGYREVAKFTDFANAQRCCDYLNLGDSK